MIIGTTNPNQRTINHTITTPTLFRISWNAAANAKVRVTDINEDLPPTGFKEILVVENKTFVVTAVDENGLQTLRTINIIFDTSTVPVAPTIPTAPATPTYSLIAAPTTVTEGSTITFTLNTTNVSNDTAIPYSISGNNITSSDISGGSLTGNFIIQNNTASVLINVTSDLIVENAETLIMTSAGQTASVVIIDPPVIGAGALLKEDGLVLELQNSENFTLQT